MHKMCKTENFVVVPRIRHKFRWMISMDVEHNHIKYEKDTQQWREWVSQGAGLGFKIYQRRPKNALLGASLSAYDVPRGVHLQWNQPR